MVNKRSRRTRRYASRKKRVSRRRTNYRKKRSYRKKKVSIPKQRGGADEAAVAMGRKKQASAEKMYWAAVDTEQDVRRRELLAKVKTGGDLTKGEKDELWKEMNRLIKQSKLSSARARAAEKELHEKREAGELTMEDPSDPRHWVTKGSDDSHDAAKKAKNRPKKTSSAGEFPDMDDPSDKRHR